MHVSRRTESLLLLFGDLLIFFSSLWLMLVVRYLEIPNAELFARHLEPFSILFGVWVLVFFIAGLYEKHTLILRSKLTNRIWNAQMANCIIAVLFFYLIPYFAITPKTNLFIYLAISFGLILLWRNYGQKLLSNRGGQTALLVGEEEKVKKLQEEINENNRYPVHIAEFIDTRSGASEDVYQRMVRAVKSCDIEYVIVNLSTAGQNAAISKFYNEFFPDVYFFDVTEIYEEALGRFPVSLIDHEWCFNHLAFYPHRGYDLLKRLMDIVIASILGILSLILYPFVAAAIKLEDGDPVFIVQERIGFNGEKINIYKFRSMTTNDSGEWLDDEGDNRVTYVGSFLRSSRIDELPQLWNVVRGDISLVGPRPDIIGLWKKLREEVPFYEVRTLVKPGLSGWAQINQDEPPQSLEKTKLRLSYDIYYIKNRSFLLDLKIALRTIATLLSRAGR